MGLTDMDGGAEFTGSPAHYVASFNDLNDWGDNFRDADVYLVNDANGAEVQISNATNPYRIARIPHRGVDASYNRWVVVGKVPASPPQAWKIRVRYNSQSVTTTVATSVGSPGTLSYAGGTFTHSPPSSGGPWWLLGIWMNSGLPTLGWRWITGGANGTTTESDPEFRPTASSGAPFYAVVIGTAHTNTNSDGRKSMTTRVASNIVAP